MTIRSPSLNLPPPESEERQFLFDRILDDTGFFCRFVLGMDTDRDEHGNAVSEIGKGGVRDYGPHAELISFIDDRSTDSRLIWAPRFTYKSSIALGYILRLILRHPDISILLCMHNSQEAKKRCRVIRDILTTNPIIKELWGPVKGPLWSADSFTTSLRRNQTLFTPTLFVGSPEKGLAGGRPNEVVFDDIVDETDVGSELKLEKGIAFVENALALSGKGTRYTMIATPWDEGDAGHHVQDAGWKKCTHLDIGFEVYETDKGLLALRGEQRWPNLSLKHLQGMLDKGMRYEKFSSQFLLKCSTGTKARFARHHFQPCKWNEVEHRDLTGYLLCDVAPSGDTGGDLNVLMYVGIDERMHIYILDLEIGFFGQFEFCDRYLNMLQRWQKRVTHNRELWEKGQTFFGYTQHISMMARQRNVRVGYFAAVRNQTAASKPVRIECTAAHFQSWRVHVMDTVPKAWSTGTKIEELWNPAGEVDAATKVPMPSGEMVTEFVRFPYRRLDIPDTFALVDSLDPQTQQRVCCWVRPASRAQPAEQMRNEPQERSRREGPGSATRFFDRYAR